MRPEDLPFLRVPGIPALHGDTLVVAVSSPDLRADGYRGGLWQVPLTPGGTPRRITGGRSDTQPRISPDGAWVAFLRVAGDSGTAARPQVYLLPTAGGEAIQLTDLPLGAGVPAWAPDSRSLAWTARVPEPGRYGTTAGVGPEAEAPRRITRFSYRFDGIGFIGDRPAQVHVAELPGPDGVPSPPRRLTELDVDAADPAFTPDGRHVLFTAQRALGADGDTLHTDVYAVSVAGGEPVLVVRSEGTAEYPTADGDTVYYCGEQFTGRAVALNPGLWSAPLRLTGEPGTPLRLTDTETVAVERAPGPPVLIEGGVLVPVAHRGAVQVRLVPTGAKEALLDELPLLAGEDAAVLGFTAHSGRTVAAVSTVDDPGELVLLGENPVTLTEFNAEARATGLLGWQEIDTAAPDGYPVHGWVMLPKGPGPHPVLLNIHGGPFRFYSRGFFDEAQIYAEAGYAVVLGNPRGSASYGQAHGAVLAGPGFGTVEDTGDLLALLDAALELPGLDPARVGVMGGSYGGLMTGILAAKHGERFVAAWSERALNAWDSFVGSSDIGWSFATDYCADEETQRRSSPLTYADQITIPFLIAHSEQDWRCPLEQAQRMFVALRRNGTPTEMLLFPGEGHELTRGGRPKHRLQRFEAVLDWWSRHLG
ncbi:S9 family peptidase [Crossiella cryophila]|uniref:Dipeptidyl aminopeptidase/acylaminoacyl peptidase n=1 Tax=Crossiella cryophila TaxID=43355 RepID=A0A7W7CH79_9PSEU|nr:S9 family peptidase [Crossiella cryophila]MBB4681205.1 dipeptidyl aminopeptidase/acylaminoacyl peptidase [Crossiella cryophila]